MIETGIMTDGTVELMQRWRPGGAQGAAPDHWTDGEQYVFAIRLSTDHWDFHVVTVACDPELGTDFRTNDGESWDVWDWDSVEWFVPCSELDLPFNG